MNNKQLLSCMLLVCFSLLGLKQVNAQVPKAFGPFSLHLEQARNEQVLGLTDSTAALTIATPQSVNTQKKEGFTVLPIVLLQQYNSFAPYGWNDGLLLPSKGYQAFLSAGFKFQHRRWQVQINPEVVYAANPAFDRFPQTETDAIRSAYANYRNFSDLPDRFGNSAVRRSSWGQTALKYTADKWSFGISNENLWWGPGNRNTLLMSNNAPGFWHLTLHTSRPLKTKLGSFETKIIAGRLKGSQFASNPEAFEVNGQNVSIAKPTDWRYLSGLSIAYQPKWIPGLYLGLNRVFQVYRNDLGNGLTDYLPFITPLQKKGVPGEDAKKRDQLASLYFRWVLPESKTEIYGEYGWNDHKQNVWDLLVSPSHAAAFLIGMRKLFPIQGSTDKYLRLNLELTQLQQSADRLVRPAGAWYMHSFVRHGYSHQGQTLGAGIGPGANSQTLDIAFWNKNQVFGVQLERYAHNLDFFYDAYTQVMVDYNRKWTDIMLNTYTYRQWGQVGLRAALNAAWIRNYQWQEDRNPLNMQVQLGLNYRFERP